MLRSHTDCDNTAYNRLFGVNQHAEHASQQTDIELYLSPSKVPHDT